MKRHPFEGTPQYEQVYGNAFGPPIGYPGNGLGVVCGWFTPIEGDDDYRIRRPSTAPDFEEIKVATDEELDPRRQQAAWLLYELMSVLTDRQRFVLEMRLGLRDTIRYTQEETAAYMGVSQQAVAEHEAAIEKKAEKLLVKLGIEGWFAS